MRVFETLPLAVLYLALVLPALLALWVGMLIGRRARAAGRNEPEAPLGTLVGTLLGLLAFLLGFSFNSAAGRYEARRQLVISEANAVGTAYLRAGLLPQPQGSEIRALLREYADARLRAVQPGQQDASLARSREIHREVWARFAAVGPPRQPAKTRAYCIIRCPRRRGNNPPNALSVSCFTARIVGEYRVSIASTTRFVPQSDRKYKSSTVAPPTLRVPDCFGEYK